jgi:hypothetical protein
MSEATKDNSIFKMPANGREYAALGIALLAVFVLVQFGAPLVRQMEFLDQKFREFFISGAFVAFPFIHRGVTQMLLGFGEPAPLRRDLSPWFVSGAFVASLVFAWNQIVGILGGIALAVFVELIGVPPTTTAEALAEAQMTSAFFLTLPLTAIAAVYAGVLLYRNTRSHVLAALLFAVVLFMLSNVLVTSVLAPGLIEAQWAKAAAAGPDGIVQFLVGVGLVAAVVFVSAGIGVLVSHFRSESSLGKVMMAARRLSPADREALAADIVKRIEAAAASGR